MRSIINNFSVIDKNIFRNNLSTYAKYEKSSKKLSNEVVKKLAKYYTVSVI